MFFVKIVKLKGKCVNKTTLYECNKLSKTIDKRGMEFQEPEHGFHTKYVLELPTGKNVDIMIEENITTPIGILLTNLAPKYKYNNKTNNLMRHERDKNFSGDEVVIYTMNREGKTIDTNSFYPDAIKIG